MFGTMLTIAGGVFLGGLLLWLVAHPPEWWATRQRLRAFDEAEDRRVQLAISQGFPGGGLYDLELWENAWQAAAGDPEKQRAAQERAVARAREDFEADIAYWRDRGDRKRVEAAERGLARLKARFRCSGRLP